MIRLTTLKEEHAMDDDMHTDRSVRSFSRTARSRKCEPGILPMIVGITGILMLVLGTGGCSDDDCSGPGDIEAPRVSSTFPAEGDTNIAPDTVVTVTFNENIDPASISAGSFTLEGPHGPVTAAVSFDGLTATLTPYVQLGGHSLYTARVDDGVSDLAGNRMGVPYAWSFKTGTTQLILYPYIEFTVRDIDGNETPDVLVGGGPPGQFLQAGVSGMQADRAVMEFPLGEILQDEVLEAIIYVNISDNTAPLSVSYVEVWGFSGDGAGEASDWNGGHRILVYDDLFLSAGDTYAFPMTDTINQALIDGATHVGFRIVVTGEPVVQFATSNGLTGYDGTKILLTY